MTPSFDLRGRLAVVTGAKRGIGFAMAEALASAGSDIIAVSATIEEQGSAIGAVVTALGREFEAIRCDFADRAAVEALSADLAAREVDILVNNAGTIRRSPAAEHPAEWWDEVIQVDLSSQFFLTQAVAQGMLARRRGKSHLHGVAAHIPGRHQCSGVCRRQVGHRRSDQGSVERMGCKRRHRERDRTGLYRHRQHPGSSG